MAHFPGEEHDIGDAVMGFFSVCCPRCGKSIANKHSSRPEDSDCVLVLPNGERVNEPAYDGYGTFAGYDMYSLYPGTISEQYNSPQVQVFHKRCLADSDNPADFPPSLNCPEQGYFFNF